MIAIFIHLEYIFFMARKPLTTSVDNGLQKEVKKLAIDLERPFNDLLEEALRDLLKKYDIAFPKD